MINTFYVLNNEANDTQASDLSPDTIQSLVDAHMIEYVKTTHSRSFGTTKFTHFYKVV